MNFKLLVIADRPPKQSIVKTISENEVDAIVTLGDLEYFQINELANIQHIPKIGVYGNHDSGTYMNDLGIINLHLNTFNLKGITIGGFEGSIKYKESVHAKMYTQEDSLSLLKDFKAVDLLITHSPPFGIHDHQDLAHIGLLGILEYLKKNNPQYMIHGHTYIKEQDKVVLFNNTKVIHVSSDEIITLELNLL